MKLGHIEILAENPAQTKQFYCDALGFEVVTIQNDQFIWLKKGEQEILIRPGGPQNPESRYQES